MYDQWDCCRIWFSEQRGSGAGEAEKRWRGEEERKVGEDSDEWGRAVSEGGANAGCAALRANGH